MSGIEDLGGRIDFDFAPNPNHDIKFGTSYTYHHFFPGESTLNFSIDYPFADTLNQDINLDKYLDGGGDIRSLMSEEQNKIFVESPMISPKWHVKTQAVFQK